MKSRLAGILPTSLRRWLVRQTRIPRVGSVDLGQLRRVTPISRDFGGDRGKPIDRHFIERFLEEQAGLIRGTALEVGNDTYTRRFGGKQVTRACVVDIDPENPRADYVADLALGDGLPSEEFDCVICAQTLHLIYDVAGSLATLHRILRPGGSLLLTVPGITQIDAYSAEVTGEYWRFTSFAIRRLLLDAGFDEAELDVRRHGNVLTSIGFLHGLALDELTPEELAHEDPRYPFVIVARATRSAESS
jgi:SAM-dependent methyltransferase